MGTTRPDAASGSSGLLPAAYGAFGTGSNLKKVVACVEYNPCHFSLS